MPKSVAAQDLAWPAALSTAADPASISGLVGSAVPSWAATVPMVQSTVGGTADCYLRMVWPTPIRPEVIQQPAAQVAMPGPAPSQPAWDQPSAARRRPAHDGGALRPRPRCSGCFSTPSRPRARRGLPEARTSTAAGGRAGTSCGSCRLHRLASPPRSSRRSGRRWSSSCGGAASPPRAPPRNRLPVMAAQTSASKSSREC